VGDVRVYGLTGNIGSGKSTVARLFAEAGVPVIDADQLAREVVLPGTEAHAEIARRFPGVVDAAGVLDRKALAARVFADAGERAALNAIVHPRIAQQAAARTQALSARGFPFAIYEAALIVENGLQRALDALILVSAPEELRLRRVMQRDGSSEEEARARIASQLPEADKEKLADFVIRNGGDQSELKQQVDEVLARLRKGFAAGRR
jgi:dephospho-CoA kinase